ncbi:MAG: 2-oxo acid dehydrogenase subunit E2 [Anaerolineales bacterium]|nr:2-oxo acid dehydrogenase subunit E2 [Anaerolineales bacterium]
MTAAKTYQVVMPKLGLIMEEAILTEWHKLDGDLVVKGEPLFSFESEKSVIDIEAPAGGTLQILVQAGQKVPVLTPVANLSGAEAGRQPRDQPAQPARGQAITRPAAQKGTSSETAAAGITASPRARFLARQRGLSLPGVQGSGIRGMVVASDLPAADPTGPVRATPLARKLAREFGLQLESIRGSGPDGRIERGDVHAAVAARLKRSASPDAPAARPDLPLTGLRGIIARRLTESWQERPQVTLVTELDVSELVKARKTYFEKHGAKLSYNAILTAACAQALKEFPAVNARLEKDGLKQLKDIHIGLAVETENGLMVPVLNNVDTLSVSEIEEKLQTLVERTLDGTALPDELSGGTFTITNLGVFGVDAFTPILNPPEAAILGVGRILARPVVIDGNITIRETLTLSLVFDHRLIDGAPAARFLQRLSELLQQPDLMIGLSNKSIN